MKYFLFRFREFYANKELDLTVFTIQYIDLLMAGGALIADTDVAPILRRHLY
jgi:hypothetical protein